MNETLSLSHLGLSLVAGSLTTLSPCVFPILPLVVGGAVQANRLAPVAMGIGMATSFALIGLLLGALGPALGIDSQSVRTFGGVMLVAFAAVMLIPALSRRFTELMLPIASSANAASSRLDGGSLGGAFLLGGLLGLIWSPCSGPLLASALTLVASDGGAGKGALILGLFGTGAALPLVAVAYASRSGFAKARGWVLTRVETVKKGLGVLIGLTGLAILTGGDKWLETRLVNVLPDAWVNLTTLF
ncbi:MULTISPECIES: cytochrome c biogenesis protein CcdA [Zoogloea]|jgi:cytochrome c biogenesis protein CcdA|uniref:Cytochrome c biogenesis protein CcdA n=1 Tax=Zoogloea oleivorans TaxID=1552750 RepID=A0A6C2CQZ5_9RHOO|nr:MULTISPECIES: cytochrome c biogenesis protein CcdA [Zoogloea]MBP8133274.1 sulfite exporter TauE/SafE family protein [Zoogloea sp.]MDD2668747.1 cytochrome c biogenesis protein CcdA [Zoogloea sp.]MDY0035146.1 cytochrome c biogenesis protein CcdA [Zoogloea oleivorans]TYC56517.1 cytochrome c biogenesis protein CcdA [Zoogloea oleivorans]